MYMSIHHNRFHLNTSYMSDIGVGYSLKGRTASTIAKRHGFQTYVTSAYSRLDLISGKTFFGDNGVRVHPSAHPLQ